MRKRNRKGGRPRIYGPRDRCRVQGCRRKPRASWMCAMHYLREWKLRRLNARLGRRGRRV